MLDERRKLAFLRSQGLPLASIASFGPMQFQPRVIGGWVLLALALRSPIAIGVLAVVLAWNAVLPALNPFDVLYNRWLHARLGGEPLGPARPPRRFAQALASLMLAATAGMMVAGWTWLAMTMALPFLGAVALVTLRGICVGSMLFRLFRRLHRFRRAHQAHAEEEAEVTPRLEA